MNSKKEARYACCNNLKPRANCYTQRHQEAAKYFSGEKLLIKAKKDQAVITPLPDDPVEYFCGFFKDRSSLTKALINERHKERDRESKNIAR